MIYCEEEMNKYFSSYFLLVYWYHSYSSCTYLNQLIRTVDVMLFELPLLLLNIYVALFYSVVSWRTKNAFFSEKLRLKQILSRHTARWKTYLPLSTFRWKVSAMTSRITYFFKFRFLVFKRIIVVIIDLLSVTNFKLLLIPRSMIADAVFL